MAQTVQTAQTQETPQRSVRVVLMALLIAIMLAMLDNMIIGTAMPTIVGELGGPATSTAARARSWRRS
jgi:hypothetical protein